jgi:hypothetical protein
MKTLMTVGLMACVLGSFASADTFTVNHGENGQTVSLNGGVNGVAQEVFTIMDKAGVQATQYIEGKNLTGKNMTAYVAFLNGARYGATLTIDSASSLQISTDDLVGGKFLRINGDIAEELFGYMEKSGAVEHRGVDSAYLSGKDVNCSVIYSGGGRYSCSLHVRQ